MTDFDFDDCRAKLRQASEAVIAAEGVFKVAAAEAADAEAVYRHELAEKYRAYRTDGKPATEADTLARGDAIEWSRERDYRASLLKLAGERLENVRDSRRSLWRLIEWARGRDLARTGAPESAPGDRWP